MDRYETTARAILAMGPCILCARAADERFLILPGGHVDPGEHVLEALRREWYEEVGVPLATVQKLVVLPNVWMRRGGDVVHETMHLYAATTTRPLTGDLLPRSPEAATQLRWASVDDLMTGRAPLVPTALLPWVVRVAGRMA